MNRAGTDPPVTTPPPETSLFPVERDPKLKFIIPLTVAMGFTLEQLDTTIITTAIPAMAKSLNTTAVTLSLAVTTYVLVLAVFIPISGWFADRFGARRVFTTALVVFSLGSALCGVSINLPMLIAARALQGLGGAMMTPVGRLVLLRSFPREQIVTAMTYMTLPAIVGPVLGPVLGGFLTTYASWRWAFFINIPFGILGVFLALRFIEEVPATAAKRFDFKGFLLFALAVAALQYALGASGRNGGAIALVLTLSLSSVILFSAFLYHAKRTKLRPAIDLSVFEDRAFRIGALAGGLTRMPMSAIPFLLPLMLQLGFGASPLQSGLITVVSVVGAVAIRPLLSRLLRAFGFDRLLGAVSLLCAATLAAFSLVVHSTPTWLLASLITSFGVVRSLQFMGANTLAYADLAPDKLSAATSLGAVLQQLSGSFGVSIAAALLALIVGQHSAVTVSAFHSTFLFLAGLPLLAAPFFFMLHPSVGSTVSGHVRGKGWPPVMR